MVQNIKGLFDQFRNEKKVYNYYIFRKLNHKEYARISNLLKIIYRILLDLFMVTYFIIKKINLLNK